MTDEELTALIADEAEHITLDFEARSGVGLIHVLAIASMGLDAHKALDNCKLTKQLDAFARGFVDEAYAAALRDRGWRVERPEVAKGSGR